MHQQIVLGVGLETLGLGDAGCHRHGRHTCRTNQRVNLILAEDIHQLGQQHTATGTDTERHDSDSHDAEGAPLQESIGSSGCAHGNAQEDDHDIVELVLDSFAETLHNAALAEQVAEHKAADQRSCRGEQQRDDNGDHNREEDLLPLGDVA